MTNTEIVDLFEDERWDTLRDEALRLNRENASLREQLRLTNDKMEARVRKERHSLAEEAIARFPGYSVLDRRHSEFWSWLEHVRDANAPKD